MNSLAKAKMASGSAIPCGGHICTSVKGHLEESPKPIDAHDLLPLPHSSKLIKIYCTIPRDGKNRVDLYVLHERREVSMRKIITLDMYICLGYRVDS